MGWFIVPAVLIIFLAIAWWMDRRHRAIRDSSSGSRFDPSANQGQVAGKALMTDRFTSGLRKERR
jgi:hypothetical protein